MMRAITIFLGLALLAGCAALNNKTKEEVAVGLGASDEHAIPNPEGGVALEVKVFAVNAGRDEPIAWDSLFSGDALDAKQVMPLSTAPAASYFLVNNPRIHPGRFANTDLIVERLKSLGKVSMIASTVLTSVDGSPASVSAGETFFYVSRNEKTSSFMLKPVDAGFRATFVPGALGDEPGIGTQVAIRMSRVLSLDAFETPRFERVQLALGFPIPGGRSLMIAGLSFDSDHADPESHERLVVQITPWEYRLRGVVRSPVTTDNSLAFVPLNR